MFSILIPSWNNLPYLKLCVESIQKHSTYPHQIIIHINEGADGTQDWVAKEGIEYTFSQNNVGICKAVNAAGALAKMDYVVFMNDDMCCCPGWDIQLVKEIKSLDTDCFMLSSTMIEPKNTNNPCVVVHDFGDSVESFREEELLKMYALLKKDDWSGSAWPPNVVHRKYWELVGGYSEEFSPGMSSDDDFAMKMWMQAGCRLFKGVGASKVYHFQCKSTGRVVKNNGRKQFLYKWKLKQSTFNRFYLKRGQPYLGVLSNPTLSIGLIWQRLLAWIERIATR